MMQIKNGKEIWFYGSQAGVLDKNTNTATVDNRFRCGELMDWLADKGFIIKWV